MVDEQNASYQLRADTLERMERAVEQVYERVRRTAAALEHAGLLYAVAGGNAVGAWVAQVDESAVRYTQDVDVLIRREDLSAVAAALAPAGFIHRHAAGIDFFVEGQVAAERRGGFRHGIHLLFAGEKVRPEYLLPAADVTEAVCGPSFRYLSLEALVRMKLTSFRPKDQTHLDDLLRVGLIDNTWTARFPAELAARLQQILDAFEPDPDNIGTPEAM